MPQPQQDVIVVGGSFAGLSAAMQLARARRRVIIIDAGKPRNRFAEVSHGFLGLDGRSPAAIMAEGARQLLAYPPAALLWGEAVSARAEDGGFVVALADGEELRGARLILATGITDELPGLPGLAERWGRTVLHCPYCHGYEVRDRPLGVLAAHPMSTHQAMLIADWGPTTLFTQGRPLDASEVEPLKARGVAIEPVPVVELLGRAPELEAVRLEDGRVVPLGALFTACRTRMASPLAEQIGCAMEEGPLGPFIQVDGWKLTSVPGVYAAGDASSAMSNATFASASGVAAGVAAHRSLFMP